MRLFRHLVLCACLLLAGSTLVGTRIAPEYAQGLLLVQTIEGCRVWLDSWLADSDATWSGGCSGKVRLADGFGRLDLIDRSGELNARFDGTMIRGHKSPHGRDFQLHSREVFSPRNGRDGTEIIDGVRYEGGFLGERRDGVGYMIWPNGDAYRGGWKNGLPSGYGETLLGKKVIAGQWRDGCLLDSARTVAVAVPLQACAGLAAGPNPSVPEPDVTMRRVRMIPEAPKGEGGCVPVEPGSYFRWCK